jgi:hypothetical protein
MSRATILWNIVQIYIEDQELCLRQTLTDALRRTTDGQRHNIIRPVLRRVYKNVKDMIKTQLSKSISNTESVFMTWIPEYHNL